MAIATRALLLLTVMQITFGALVAGLRAGRSYNTYPLMDGQFIPEGLHQMQPWWLNHLESVVTVQFQHRMGALLIVAYGLFFITNYYRRSTASLRPALRFLMATIITQFVLGVATLLSGVNIALASLHQLVALLLVSLLVWLIYLTPLDQNQSPAKKQR